MPQHECSSVMLVVTVKNNVTILPRLLQILSRRGVTLTELRTETLSESRAKLHCTLMVPEQWHSSLSSLLLKLVDVEAVSEVKVDGHE